MSGQFRDSYHKCILLQSLQKKLLTEGISGQYKSTLKSEANDCLETYYHYDTICEMDLDLAKEAEMGMVKTIEEFISVTLAIGDTYGDDVRGNDLGAGHGG